MSTFCALETYVQQVISFFVAALEVAIAVVSVYLLGNQDLLRISADTGKSSVGPESDTVATILSGGVIVLFHLVVSGVSG